MLMKLIGRMQDGMVARATARTTRRELGSLSRRELNDIGLSFYDIDRIALESGRLAYAASQARRSTTTSAVSAQTVTA